MGEKVERDEWTSKVSGRESIKGFDLERMLLERLVEIDKKVKELTVRAKENPRRVSNETVRTLTKKVNAVGDFLESHPEFKKKHKARWIRLEEELMLFMGC
ncbi:MAG: hypothetical protein WC595_00770 [Candidatus Nanoarchaeia archaeon]